MWDGAEPDPFATARVIRGLVKARDSGMPVDEARLTRAADWLAALDAKAMRDPPVLTDAEKAAIALSGRIAEPGATVDDGVRAAVRFLLDRRQGPAWCGPSVFLSVPMTTTSIVVKMEAKKCYFKLRASLRRWGSTWAYIWVVVMN